MGCLLQVLAPIYYLRHSAWGAYIQKVVVFYSQGAVKSKTATAIFESSSSCGLMKVAEKSEHQEKFDEHLSIKRLHGKIRLYSKNTLAGPKK